MFRQAGRRTREMKHYIALIHKEPDSGYGVSFPDVPGVIAVADSLDEALREASVVLAFAFEDWRGSRPESRSLDDLRRDPEFLQDSANAVVAAVAPAARLADAA
jgi:predicted RNase H-like HicB family nuclease